MFTYGKRIGITGATGHIGNVLCSMLLAQGYELGALVYHDDQINPEIRITKGSITNPVAVDDFVQQFDVIIHLAARIAVDGKGVAEMNATNVNGTQNIVNACLKHQIKRLVHFTSIAAINQFPLNETLDETRDLIDDTMIGTRYGKSKSAGEKIVLNGIEKGLNVVMIAPTSVMGPFDRKPSILGQTLIDLYNNAIPALIKGGYDWVDVRDICQGTIAAMEKGKAGNKYLLGGAFMTIQDLSLTVGDLFQRKVPTKVLPNWVAALGVPFEAIKSKITGRVNGFTFEALTAIKYGNQNISHEKAKRELGYDPMSVRDSIKDSIEWFKENEML